MSIGPDVGFLRCPSKVRFDFFFTQFANPHVDDMSGFTIKVGGNTKWDTIHCQTVCFIGQRALSTTTSITLLISGDVVIVAVVVAGVAMSDAYLFVTYKDVANCTSLFRCHYYTCVSNQLIEFLLGSMELKGK